MGKEDGTRVVVFETDKAILRLLEVVKERLPPHVVLDVISNASVANELLLDIIKGDELPYDYYFFAYLLLEGHIDLDIVEELVESSDDDNEFYDISHGSYMNHFMDSLPQLVIIELIEKIFGIFE